MRQMIKRVFKIHAFVVKNRKLVSGTENDISSMSLHAYYNPQNVRFVLFIPKIFERQNCGANMCLISLSLV